MNPFEKRPAVVTGASRGLGRAIAIALARQGSPVALVSRRREDLELVAREITAVGGTAGVFPTDVTSEEEIRNIESAIRRSMGEIRILVNNAGIALRRNITDITLDDWNSVQSANITSAFLMSRAFIPHMKTPEAAGQPWGRIVSVASVMAHVSIPQRAAYSASKSALLGLTRVMALELAGDGISVNTISPGWFETEMTAPIQNNPEVNAATMLKVPMGRWGRPEELGSLAAYLCTDLAGFITGTDIIMDGGWCAS
jgi:NAD(P)-dependent dehydrogenase (short-subunit alcohol dehydrogenase family)